MRRIVGELIQKEMAAERARQDEARQERQSLIAEILADAGAPPPPRRKPKRDRHGMHIVRSAIPPAAATAFLRAHARHAFVAATAAALLTGTAVAPPMLANAPAAQVPHARHAARHHHVPVPVVTASARRKRRRGEDHDADDMARISARPQQSATPAPVPSPQPTPTAPVPEPSPTTMITPPPPDPTPAPTRAPGEVVAGALALRGLLRVP